MSISEFMALADVKSRLSEVVDEVGRESSHTVITKHGKPAAVVISIDEYESMVETLEILADASLVEDIFRSNLEQSEAIVLTADQLRERLARRK
jgi:prevent-host-death family protein